MVNQDFIRNQGDLAFFARLIVPAGEGLLKVTFEKLKAKLENEGLFDLNRKRDLVAFPQKIGLITAKDSQAYKDFVKVLQERLGGIKLYYYPVSVQGKIMLSINPTSIQLF